MQVAKGIMAGVQATVLLLRRCQLNNCVDRFIDMKGRIKKYSQINHFD